MTTTGDLADRATVRRTGALTLSVLGLVCALVGSTGLSTGGVLTRLVAVGIAGLVVLAVLRHRGPGQHHRPRARRGGALRSPRHRLTAGVLAVVVAGGLVAWSVDAAVGRSVLGLGVAVTLWWAALPPSRRGDARAGSRSSLGG